MNFFRKLLNIGPVWSYYRKRDFIYLVCPHSFLGILSGELRKKMPYVGAPRVSKLSHQQIFSLKKFKNLIKFGWFFCCCCCFQQLLWWPPLSHLSLSEGLTILCSSIHLVPCNLSSGELKKSDLIDYLAYPYYVRVGMMFSCSCLCTKQRWSTPPPHFDLFCLKIFKQRRVGRISKLIFE